MQAAPATGSILNFVEILVERERTVCGTPLLGVVCGLSENRIWQSEQDKEPCTDALNFSVSTWSSTSAPLAVLILPFMELWQARQFADSWQRPGLGSKRSVRKSKGATKTNSLLFDISTSTK